MVLGKKLTMEIPKELKKEIIDYCKLNNIEDVDAFILKNFKQGFNIEKYGTSPFKVKEQEPKIIEKEIIKTITATTEVEVIKEVPVEVIKEVEVEVVKEVIKEVTVTDNELINKLNDEIEKLNKDKKQIQSQLSKEVNKSEDVENQESNEIIKLNQKINNLQSELEIEKNRNYVAPKTEKPKEEKKSKSGLNSIIKWVSKNDRDLYDE